jgi:AcrR family transcriptional regulator
MRALQQDAVQQEQARQGAAAREPARREAARESPWHGDRPAGGLRELKKARTRASIQEHALRLFLEHGYAATTVEQIAQAAEVSPSTFFRYFPTKEDVVLYDDFDPLLISAYRGQPAELSPVGAMRGALHTVFDSVPEERQVLERERGRLVFAVPELRARTMVEMQSTAVMLSEVIAERVGRAPGDFEVRNLTGALVGVLLTAMLDVIDDPDTGADADFLERMDAALAHLERGLPL